MAFASSNLVFGRISEMLQAACVYTYAYYSLYRGLLVYFSGMHTTGIVVWYTKPLNPFFVCLFIPPAKRAQTSFFCFSPAAVHQ